MGVGQLLQTTFCRGHCILFSMLRSKHATMYNLGTNYDRTIVMETWADPDNGWMTWGHSEGGRDVINNIYRTYFSLTTG